MSGKSSSSPRCPASSMICSWRIYETLMVTGRLLYRNGFESAAHEGGCRVDQALLNG